MQSNGLVNIIKCYSCTSMQRPATYCNSTAASEEHMLFVTSALYSGSDSVQLSLSEVESPELEPAAFSSLRFHLLLRICNSLAHLAALSSQSEQRSAVGIERAMWSSLLVRTEFVFPRWGFDWSQFLFPK